MLDNDAYTLANALTVLPNLKYLDVSGNQFSETGNKYLAQAAKNIPHSIKI